MPQKKNQKKLISFTYFELINSLVKDEAISSNRNESAIIEDIILDHYLSKNRNLEVPITHFLFLDRGFQLAAENIFGQMAALPEYVDDTTYPLIDWIKQLEWRYHTEIKGSYSELSHFLRAINDFSTIINRYMERTKPLERKIQNVDGREVLLDEFELRHDLMILQDILDVEENKLERYPERCVLDVLNIICRLWNLPLLDGRPLHKTSSMYRWLVDVMQRCKYPSTPEVRFNFVNLVRNINFYDK